jgi:hypothetical protein
MIITGKLRDVWMNVDGPVLVIDHPRTEGKIIREHINIRQRDMRDAFVTGLKIGIDVRVSGELSKYIHNGAEKTCIKNVKSIRPLKD